MKHTQGKWQYGKPFLTNKYGGTIIIHLNGVPIAKVFEEIGRETAEANARLIASAPELLEACKEAILFLESLGNESEPDFCFDIYNKLEQAISKAEGV